MTTSALVMTLALGSALLALWSHLRFPRLAPSGMRYATLHLAMSFGIVSLSPFGVAAVLNYSPTVVGAMVGLFAVLLPALVYSFLSALWLIRLFQRVIPAR